MYHSFPGDLSSPIHTQLIFLLHAFFITMKWVSHVESFMDKFPDGDPAQHLIEELFLRAAKKAGLMEFHELLNIPHGDRRKNHDDVIVMVISLEGRLWKSMKCPNWQHSRYTGEAEALIHALWLPASSVEVPRLTTLVHGPEGTKMAKGLIWATAEDLARNKGQVLSLYRQLLRSLNSPDLPLNLGACLAKKAEVRAIFMVASEERSLHNIQDLFDAADYSLSLLRKGEIPKYIQ
ncbi:hypothetical protein RHSIM_Rhsim07G0124700 [Rhododendron simsii]|uniref:LYR motif containing domain-containing protein n=1 Tax=Rhododendron simsii TaxID=118357 RepID=A0A834H0U1_RHOSS|nr:hypothetical protein RHSIM_Rhsim07G0124700 [Rhododendron simsii]